MDLMHELNQLAVFLGLPINGFWPPKLAATMTVCILAGRRGRNVWGWAFLGAVVPLFALGAILFAPPRAQVQTEGAVS